MGGDCEIESSDTKEIRSEASVEKHKGTWENRSSGQTDTVLVKTSCQDINCYDIEDQRFHFQPVKQEDVCETSTRISQAVNLRDMER